MNTVACFVTLLTRYSKHTRRTTAGKACYNTCASQSYMTLLQPSRPVRQGVVILMAVTLLLPLTILVRQYCQYNFFGLQDEGILLTYPDLMLRGYIPYVDFATVYTPGNYYILAAVYRIFGESVSIERSIGIVYWFLTVSAIFLIGLRVSPATAVLSALIALGYVSLFDAPAALPHFAAYAVMLFAMLLLSKSADANGVAAKLYAFFAGLLAAATIWLKQDIGAVAIIATLTGASALDFARVRALLSGFALAAGVLLMFVLGLGLDKFVGSVIVGALRTAPGVALPITLNLSVVVVFICVGANIVAAYLAAGAGVPKHLLCLTRSIATMSAGLSLAALHRFGPYDVSYLGVPIVGLTLVSLNIATTTLVRTGSAALLAIYFSTGLLPVLVGHLAWPHRSGVRISHVVSEGRVVPWALFAADSTDPQPILDRINVSSREGEKLFVGPRDLRFTVQNDAVLYYLLPKLRPASRYIEMSAGRANRFDSGLSGELSSADWIILTSQFDDHIEPNASRIPGSPEPNEVIRSHFCLRSRHGFWQLLQRCS